MGFILLLGVTSCTEPIQVNPNYNPETKEVTTNLVLSVNTGGPQTKMTATNVQRTGNFLGIDSVHLMAYKTDMSVAPYTVEPFVLDTSKEAMRDFILGTLLSNGSINASEDENGKSNRVVQLSVPVDVDAFLFYGKAISKANKSASDASSTGKSWGIVATTPSGTHFDLQQRLENETNYKHTGDLLVFIINRIISTNVEGMSPSDIPYTASGDPKDPKTQYTGLPALSWPGLGEIYGDPVRRPNLSPLEEILGAAYSKFTKIENGEYRAGSSAAIKSMMTSLMDIVESVQDANPTNDAEANACRLADAIMKRKERYFSASMGYLDVGAIKSTVITNGASTGIHSEAEWNEKFSGVTSLTGFPHTQFQIPEGAAQLDFDGATGKFEYKDPNQALANPGNSFYPNNYLYPAELTYYVNSPIRTTSEAVKTADYPNGFKTWDAESNWASNGWLNNSRVQSGTRGIAIRNNINYGVALLESKIAITSGLTNFKDNKSAKTGDANDNLIPTNNHHLVFTGVLVGGQYKTVDWQFLPKVTQSSDFQYVVFDDAIASGAIPTTAGNENYTIVFDNYDSTIQDDQPQSSVRVALEFKNEGDPFWGKDNMVPKDGIFYLIAELPVATTGNNASVISVAEPVWPDDGKYAIPPVYGVANETVPSGKTAGHSKKINRVFIQNFVTSATFTLGEKSLKNAYVTVPNLSSTQMSLGLSVDISWHTGYVYNIEL